YVPIVVSGLDPDVVSVASGYNTTCVLTSGGVTKCWGDHAYVELDGDYLDCVAVPTAIKGLEKDVVAVSVGEGGTCAITAGGRLLCWGRKGDMHNCAEESLGAMSDAMVWEPTEVVGLESGVTAVTLGQDHGCAILESGKAMCWGANNTGKVGDGTNICRPDPVEVVGFP
ncbi:MAG: hypothetical protein FWD57_16990, partial [Polyangiaceae bacterium]|nr:hypothetical protein [Polyangiaceae bacterium]